MNDVWVLVQNQTNKQNTHKKNPVPPNCNCIFNQKFSSSDCGVKLCKREHTHTKTVKQTENSQTTDDSFIRYIHHTHRRLLFEFIFARPEYYTHGDIFNVPYILLFCGCMVFPFVFLGLHGFFFCVLSLSSLTHLAIHIRECVILRDKYIYIHTCFHVIWLAGAKHSKAFVHTFTKIITMRHVRQFYIFIFTHPMAMRLCLHASIHFCINWFDGAAISPLVKHGMRPCTAKNCEHNLKPHHCRLPSHVINVKIIIRLQNMEMFQVNYKTA